MKSLLILSLLLLGSTALQANPVARKLVAQALKQAGRETLEAGAREAAEHAAAIAIRKFGAEGAEELVERGGLELLEAGAKHGDDILKTARRVPEAARYLGAQPQEAIRLVTQFGDDALLLEARVPGMAETAVAQLGRSELTLISKAPPHDVTRLLGYAGRADTPQTRTALLTAWKKSGAAVLDELDKRKMLILTGGLTASTLMVAGGASDSIRDIPRSVPEAVKDLAQYLGTACIIFAIGAVGTLWLWVRAHRTTPANVSR